MILKDGTGISRQFKSLNIYLLTTIVFFSTCVTVVVTSVQLMFEYNKNMSELESTFAQIEDSYMTSIESSLWSVNRLQLQAVIQGMLRLQDMKYVRIETSEHGVFASAGSQESSYTITKSIPINFLYKGKKRQIGTLRMDASLTGVYSRLISLCLIILLTNGIKTFLVSFFILFLVRKKITNYLEKIHMYLSENDLTKKLEPPGLKDQKHDNEITKLADAINNMRVSIGRRISVITEHTEVLYRKVEDQTSELERSNIEKTNLLRTLSHDISNPLAIVKGRASLALKNGTLDNTFRESDWLHVSKAAEAMENIINLVRDLDASKSGKAALSLEPVPLKQIFANCEFIFENRLAAKSLSLIYSGEKELLDAEVLAESVSFSNQVINNLVSNAIKFSYEGQKIFFHVHGDEKLLSVSVRDTGPGIPDPILTNLFNPTYKTNRPGTSGESGTGFGMLIVKSYVEKYGGTLEVDTRWIEDFPDSHGTSITVRLKRVRGVEDGLLNSA